MKKIIDGKVYDTDTATTVASWDNESIDNLDYVWESLYQKRTGEFFLHGQGGARTHYAQPTRDHDGWGSGERILPLSWEQARTWAENHLDANEYERIFGEVAEDNRRTVVTINLSAGALERARRAAAQAGISLSTYIESLIV